ncbi:MAG: IS4 family transposase, partial [Dehalococcoidia bacterium]|nr:IS4 family transposase [Dehalococcoidia bacterium]
MITLSPAVSLMLEMFALLFSNRWIARWQQSSECPVGKQGTARRFYQRIFSLRVTLWYLIYQRLSFDSTLAAVVTDVRQGGADRLGRRGRKLSTRVRSTKTGAYNQARQRLPLELLVAALAHLGTLLCKQVGYESAPRCRPGPAGRTRQLLDGSTLAILATPELVREFPPAGNKKGPSDWCLMRILVGFCARSGAILSAISGPVQHSEQALAWALMAQARAFTVWIGDRNFGVWSVVAKAVRHQQDVVVRLTKTRARKLCAGRPMQSGEDRALQWQPSRHDQVAPDTARKAVTGRLIYVRLLKAGRYIDLWLFTTLPVNDYPVALLVAWYGQRWQAELHFRSVKTQLKMAELDVSTPQMARKEFYAGLLAYSLVRAVMWSAGERLEEGIKTCSFSQARRILQTRLQDWGCGLAGDAEQWAQEMVRETARHTLPKRRKLRPSEVRRVRHRRQKFPPLTGSRAAARA